MESINEDIGKHIWGFFLHFDEKPSANSTTTGASAGGSGHRVGGFGAPPNSPNAVRAASRPSIGTTCTSCPDRVSESGCREVHGGVDLFTIRSLRCTNRFFRSVFDECGGWSRCAIAMKKEYLLLKQQTSFWQWNTRLWKQARLASLMRGNAGEKGEEETAEPAGSETEPGDRSSTGAPVGQGDSGTGRDAPWTTGQREAMARLVIGAIEWKKAVALRKTLLLRLLETGPFRDDAYLLAETTTTISGLRLID